MSKNGRLEAFITVPTGGWEFSATVNGTGPATVTIPAGTYSMTEFLDAIESEVENVFGGPALTFTRRMGEGGTAIQTLTPSAGTFSITWTDPELQEVLGFGGNIAAAASATATFGLYGVWMPDCPMAARYGRQDRGHIETDVRQTVSRTGIVKTLASSGSRRYNEIRWSHISRARAREDGETGGLTSFERWLYRSQMGGLSYFKAGAKVRLYWNADSTDYNDYRLLLPSTTENTPAVDGWVGLWPCAIRGYCVG